jgi:CDGSH-type Zn-finger protein
MRIVVRDNASLKIEIGEGEAFELVDAHGNAFGLGGRRVISLCRCGQSESKPFCDASHRDCGFDSVVVARDLPAPAPKG